MLRNKFLSNSPIFGLHPQISTVLRAAKQKIEDSRHVNEHAELSDAHKQN